MAGACERQQALTLTLTLTPTPDPNPDPNLNPNLNPNPNPNANANPEQAQCATLTEALEETAALAARSPYHPITLLPYLCVILIT